MVTGPMDRTYVGQVQNAAQKDQYRFAFVQPFVQSSTDRKMWEGPVRDPKDTFPQRGLVFWHDAPAGLEIGSYWQFDVVEHPYGNKANRPETYQLENPRQPIEVIDLRSKAGSTAALRRILTESGVALRTPPVGREALLWVDDELWIGPVALERCEQGLWRIARTENLARVDSHEARKDGTSPIEMAGYRSLLSPERNLGKHVGFQNWESDVAVAGRVLKRLRKLDREAFDRVGTTYAVFDACIETLDHAGLMGLDLEQALASKERIREIRSTIESNRELLEEAVAVCLETDPVKAELEKRRKAAYEQIHAEQSRRVDAELEERQKERGKLEAELRCLRDELGRLKEKIEKHETRLRDTVESFESALGRKLRAAVEAPEELFADLAIVRAALGRQDSRERNGRDRPEARIVPRASVRRVPAKPVGDKATLDGALGKGLIAKGLSPLLGQQLHASFLSGGMPVVAGSRAFEVLDVFAACAAGGRLLWLPVSSSTFEPQSLLGWFDTSSMRLIPQPGGLLDLLVEAQKTHAMYVVVLEGFNRAPVESYLLPLLACVRDAGIASARSISLACEHLLAPDDPYASVARIAWPENVLLAATPVSGLATLQIPRDFWCHALLIDSDRHPLEFGTSADTHPDAKRGPSPEVYEVAPDLWTQWLKACRETTMAGYVAWLEEAGNNLELPGAMRAMTLRLCAAGQFSLGKEAEARQLAVRFSLLPYLGDEAEGIAGWLEASGLALKDENRIVEITARLSA